MRMHTKQLTPADRYSVVFTEHDRVHVRPVVAWALVERWFSTAEGDDETDIDDAVIEPVYEFGGMVEIAPLHLHSAELVPDTDVADEKRRQTEALGRRAVKA